MEAPSIIVVVMTGIVLVVSILILLTFIIILQGKIFESIENKKKGAAQQVVNTAVAVKTPAPAPVPVIEAGISPEVVAAITAAIASMGGGRYALRSLTRVKGAKGPWSVAATISDTQPF